MRAKPLVLCGGSVQRSGGETSEPSQVYLSGISPPGPNAELRSLKAITDTPDLRITVIPTCRMGDQGAFQMTLHLQSLHPGLLCEQLQQQYETHRQNDPDRGSH